MSDPTLDAAVQQLLAPIAGDLAAGRWMRYERAYAELSKAREEDDTSLPRGEWERPMVKANWKNVIVGCTQLLSADSKDFQVAGWLCDAWIRTQQMSGLEAGVSLLVGLVENFWEQAWPAIEDGDADRRVAPFVWINERLALTVKLNVTLLPINLRREQSIKMLDWERAPSTEPKQESEPTPQTRREIRESIRQDDGPHLRHVLASADRVQASLLTLVTQLDDKLKLESPSLSRLQTAVESIRQAAQSLLQEIPEPVAEVVSPENEQPSAASDSQVPSSVLAAQASETSLASTTQAATAPNAHPSGFINRDHAYQTLAATAAYLAEIEPHSPTPYLIQRALQLGQMSMPDMMREVNADAGSMDNFFRMLGIAGRG